MKKNCLFLLFAVICLAGKSSAQDAHCYQPEARQRLLATHPEIAQAEQSFDEQIKQGIKKIDFSKLNARTTADSSQFYNDSFWYDIPIVVHIVHDYGSEYMTDNTIINNVAQWNIVYAKHNADTSEVYHYCPNFVKYIGNPHIRLHLATIDPNGNPTKGITRHRSYLTRQGGEQAKLDDWPPTSYVNIWFIHNMSGLNYKAAAYAHLPPDVAGIPYYDGVIARYDYINNDKTINHEIGHVFNLYHPWGATNDPAVACGDDGVDDTPPTMGHAEGGCLYSAPSSNQNSMYDTACAENYFKIYTDMHGNDSLVNYPDTTNTQNIMDYTYCSRMFTKGQVTRMHAALNSDVAGRNNLWSKNNLLNTGVTNAADSFVSLPDLAPVAEYNVLNLASITLSNPGTMQYFTCPPSGGNPAGLKFVNESWDATISSVAWTFGGGAAAGTSTAATVNNTFTGNGWANVSLAATSNTSGTTTNSSSPVFVAQATGMPGNGYYEEFSGATAAQWPTFNYYNNDFKWQPANVGVYDNACMEYVGFDSRLTPSAGIYPTTGMPYGDIDDMFSIPMDLSGYTGACSLNYMYSGASRSANSLDINDTLLIDYSTDRSNSWQSLAVLTKRQVDNNGAYAFAYTPTSQADWAQMSLNIPTAARTNYTVFRFRYKPGIAVGYDETVLTGSYSSGNNFYMDRVNFSPWPAGISSVLEGTSDVVVAPNPTNGDAYVILKDLDNTTARIVVSDITGKVVYTTNEQITGNDARILIPHAAIAVKGMYIVQTTTGSKVSTQKLVVE